MSKIEIIGGNKLKGDISVKGAKNALLPILAGCILCEEEVTLTNCPNLLDVKNMLLILNKLGVHTKVERDTITVNAKHLNSNVIDKDLSGKFRSSIFALGAIIGRLHKAVGYIPGGCDIGIRPIDLHLKGLCELGVKITENCGTIECITTNLSGASIVLDYPSVGATENILMASVLAKGTTYIYNCAREPEIVDLQNFLNKCGAKIKGAGTSVIVVEGVEKLYGCKHRIIGDRIVAGTYLVSGSITGGDVFVKDINPQMLKSVNTKLAMAGCEILEEDNGVRVKVNKTLREIPIIETAPYPAFPTDMQSVFMSLATVLNGTSVIHEKVFENRFMTVPELVKMGANITIKDRLAVVKGVDFLCGNSVMAKDLRGGASLVVAGLCAKGATVVDNSYHIDRGYEDIVKDLQLLGANIKKIN